MRVFVLGCRAKERGLESPFLNDSGLVVSERLDLPGLEIVHSCSFTIGRGPGRGLVRKLDGL
jgi:hypothetical protein